MQNGSMNAPYQPEEHPVRPIGGVCPFCNEPLAELWNDPSQSDFAFQVRCSFCGSRGPWSSDDGAVEAWSSVRPVLIDES